MCRSLALGAFNSEHSTTKGLPGKGSLMSDYRYGLTVFALTYSF